MAWPPIFTAPWRQRGFDARFTEINLPYMVENLSEIFHASAPFEIEEIHYEVSSTRMTGLCSETYEAKWDIGTVHLMLTWRYDRAPESVGDGETNILATWSELQAHTVLEWSGDFIITDLITDIANHIGETAYIQLTVIFVGTWEDIARHAGICIGFPEYHYYYDYTHACETADDHLPEDRPATGEMVVAPSPACAFLAIPVYGEAPLFVEFIDESFAPEAAPITAWYWSFGDGGTSTAKNPTHVYQSSGLFTATLTVTNMYGSDSCEIEIDIIGAEIDPVFTDQSWAEDHVYLDKVNDPFTVRLAIKNQGVAGNIYIYCITEGLRKDIEVSMPLGDYQLITKELRHPITWYLGYTPTEAKVVNLIFYVGAIDELPSPELSFTTAIIERINNEEKGLNWPAIALTGGGLILLGAALIGRK